MNKIEMETKLYDAINEAVDLLNHSVLIKECDYTIAANILLKRCLSDYRDWLLSRPEKT